MKPIPGSILTALGLMAVGALAWLFSGASAEAVLAVDSESLARADQRDISVRVRSVGELEPLRSTTISSELPGDRGKIIYLIEDGAEVQAGDVMVRFDATPFEEEKREATLEVMQAESSREAHRQLLEWERSQAEHRIRTADFELEVAKLDLRKLEQGEGPLELARLEGEMADAEEALTKEQSYLDELAGLVSKGYVNDAEVALVRENAERARRSMSISKRMFEAYRDFIHPTLLAKAKASVGRAEMEAQQVRISSGFKIGETQAAFDKSDRELEVARARLEMAEEVLGRTLISAPIDGMVVHTDEFRGGEKRKPRVGDTVWQNQPLLFLPDLSRMLVQTRVREVDLFKVEVGKPAFVSVDAYPNTGLDARVQSIGVLAERREEVPGGEKYFRVAVEILTEDSRLRPGMTARVEVLSLERTAQIAIPIQAIWREDGRAYCYAVAGDGFERREVRLGVSDENVIEVTEGLVRGEEVSIVLPEEERVRGTVALPAPR